MKSDATTVKAYLDSLPEDRKEAFLKLRESILKNLPKGFIECMQYGMITIAIPHETYPKGYHCDPKIPLPFISIANQKNFIALYHMGIYADPKLLQWFQDEYPKHSKAKLDMGKSCMRFKKVENIPFDLIAELSKKVTVLDWIKQYESAFLK